MHNNATCYCDYLRPDALVKNALTRALGLKTLPRPGPLYVEGAEPGDVLEVGNTVDLMAA